MPRQARKKSNCGIYHIMLRGVNGRQIFEDCDKFLQVLKDCIAQTWFINKANQSIDRGKL